MGQKRRGRNVNTATLPVGVTCSDLELSTAPNKGTENFTKIINEITSNNSTIIVDGEYYISSGTVFEHNKIRFVGLGSEISKLHLTGGTFFRASTTGESLIVFKDLEIIGDGTAWMSRLIDLSPPFLTTIKFKNCTFLKDIRMITSLMYNYASDWDYINNPVAIKKLVIEDCKFLDVYCSSGGKSPFNIADTPCATYFRRNYIKNFAYLFFSNAITNGGNSELYIKSHINATFEDNRVYCEDSFDPVIRSGIPGLYYLFAQIEGNNFYYRRNVVDGIHYFDTAERVSTKSEVGCYDTYFNGANYVAEGNTYRNLCNFAPGSQKVCLLEQIHPQRIIPGEESNRNYRNNTFIMEADYADRFAKDKLLLRKLLQGFNDNFDNLIIDNNTFDMHILIPYYLNQKARHVSKFNNNKMFTYTLDRSYSDQGFVKCSDVREDDGSWSDLYVIEMNDNVIINKMPPPSTAKRFFLLHVYQNVATTQEFIDNMNAVITIKRNYIETHGLEYTSEQAEEAKYIATHGSIDVSENTIINHV